MILLIISHFNHSILYMPLSFFFMKGGNGYVTVVKKKIQHGNSNWEMEAYKIPQNLRWNKCAFSFLIISFFFFFFPFLLPIGWIPFSITSPLYVEKLTARSWSAEQDIDDMTVSNLCNLYVSCLLFFLSDPKALFSRWTTGKA